MAKKFDPSKFEAEFARGMFRASKVVPAISYPTGIHVIDNATCGGWGGSRLVELFGTYAAGKSVIIYYTLATTQRLGGIAILIDSEGAFDKDFFSCLGGDPDKLWLADDLITDTVEGIFTFIRDRCLVLQSAGKKAPERICIGWDSIAATRSKHLAEVGMDKRDLSKPAAIEQGVELILPAVKRTNVCVIATNQLRDTIGSRMGGTHTPGGRSWKHASSQRLGLRYCGGDSASKIRDKKTNDAIGRKITGVVEKSRLGSPWGEFTLYFYTVAGYPHPFFNRPTRVGIDMDESLFEYYLEGRFYLDDKNQERVLCKDGDKGGWYILHKSIDKSQKRFHKKDWPEKLEQYPNLKSLLYHDIEIDPNTLATLVPGTDG